MNPDTALFTAPATVGCFALFFSGALFLLEGVVTLRDRPREAAGLGVFGLVLMVTAVVGGIGLAVAQFSGGN